MRLPRSFCSLCLLASVSVLLLGSTEALAAKKKAEKEASPSRETAVEKAYNDTMEWTADAAGAKGKGKPFPERKPTTSSHGEWDQKAQEVLKWTSEVGGDKNPSNQPQNGLPRRTMRTMSEPLPVTAGLEPIISNGNGTEPQGLDPIYSPGQEPKSLSAPMGLLPTKNEPVPISVAPVSAASVPQTAFASGETITSPIQQQAAPFKYRVLDQKEKLTTPQIGPTPRVILDSSPIGKY